jgi:hypothetical protein
MTNRPTLALIVATIVIGLAVLGALIARTATVLMVTATVIALSLALVALTRRS